jgi:hypothetical protein
VIITYDDGGVTRGLELAADSLDDLEPIFKEFLPWLAEDVAKVFHGENNWPALDDKTLQNRAANLDAQIQKIRRGAVEGISRKLAREQLRAHKRYARAENRGGGRLSIKSAAGFLARSQRTQQRHERTREAFEALRAGREARAEEAKRLAPRLIRAAVRAENKIIELQSGEPLTGMQRTLTGNVGQDFLEYFSRWDKSWIHNDGGRAGNNAEIPMRRFLEWTPARIAKLAEIAATRVANKIKK